MNVNVKKRKGEIIATTATKSISADYLSSTGQLSDTDDDDPEELIDSMFDLLGCTVVFEVEVPDADFYSVEVGRRGEIAYNREELAERGWGVSLTLG